MRALVTISRQKTERKEEVPLVNRIKNESVDFQSLRKSSLSLSCQGLFSDSQYSFYKDKNSFLC